MIITCEYCGVQLDRNPINMESKCLNKNCPAFDTKKKPQPIEIMPEHPDYQKTSVKIELLNKTLDRCMNIAKDLMESTKKPRAIRSGDLFMLDGRVCHVEFHNDMDAEHVAAHYKELIIKK